MVQENLTSTNTFFEPLRHDCAARYLSWNYPVGISSHPIASSFAPLAVVSALWRRWAWQLLDMAMAQLD